MKTLSLDLPRIAAIETSGRQGSIALALGPQRLADAILSPNQRHAVELMPALERLCMEQGWMVRVANELPRLPLEQVYLSLGPGSFTGLRIAVAIARGMAQAIGCRLVGVPSLAVIAENAPAEFGVVVPMLDAKRGQVFAARFERGAEGSLACVSEPALVEPASFLMETVRVAGEKQVAVLGEGLDYHRTAIQSAAGGGRCIVELGRELWVAQAAVVHRLGWEKAQRGEFSPPETLLPIYIRLPEAEEIWRRKQGDKG